jgi:hypothetical protein
VVRLFFHLCLDLLNRLFLSGFLTTCFSHLSQICYTSRPAQLLCFYCCNNLLIYFNSYITALSGTLSKVHRMAYACRRKRLWPYLRYRPHICPERLCKIMQISFRKVDVPALIRHDNLPIPRQSVTAWAQYPVKCKTPESTRFTVFLILVTTPTSRVQIFVSTSTHSVCFLRLCNTLSFTCKT